MIVKSISRKTQSFRELLAYISKPEEKGPLWLHNIPIDSSDPESVLWQLEENARLLRRRRNGNVLYHEILSFSSEDADRVDPAVAESVARRYLELRAPYALAAARAHFNTSCPHVHLVISANDLGSTNRLRISKSRFEEIKSELTAFVRSRFPELARSGEIFIPTLSTARGERLYESNPETERRRRGEVRPSRKEEVRDQVAAVLGAARTGEECFRCLLAAGLRIYKYGSSIGVEEISTPARKRYRLKTLGLDQQFERALGDWTALAKAQDRPGTDRTPERDRGLSR